MDSPRNCSGATVADRAIAELQRRELERNVIRAAINRSLPDWPFDKYGRIPVGVAQGLICKAAGITLALNAIPTIVNGVIGEFGLWRSVTHGQPYYRLPLTEEQRPRNGT